MTERGLAHFSVALVQMRCSTDPDDNLRPACAMLREAAAAVPRSPVLPELFRTQYFCQAEDAARFDLAEPIPGPTTEALAGVARETGMVVVGSIFERRGAGRLPQHGGRPRRRRHAPRPLPQDAHPRRSALLREVLLHARRPRLPGFRDVGSPGSGRLVCWDQWYPEAARLTALKGAEILFYPTAIGWHPAEKAEFGAAQASAWETMQRAHAIANGVYVAAVNRIGHEGPAGGGLEFWGRRSWPIPFGRILAKAGPDTRGNPHRRLRPEAPGRDPPQLAVPSRPADRRLRADHPAVP